MTTIALRYLANRNEFNSKYFDVIQAEIPQKQRSFVKLYN